MNCDLIFNDSMFNHSINCSENQILIKHFRSGDYLPNFTFWLFDENNVFLNFSSLPFEARPTIALSLISLNSSENVFSVDSQKTIPLIEMNNDSVFNLEKLLLIGKPGYS